VAAAAESGVGQTHDLIGDVVAHGTKPFDERFDGCGISGLTDEHELAVAALETHVEDAAAEVRYVSYLIVYSPLEKSLDDFEPIDKVFAG
jgi:hypothetical protein